MSDEKHQEKTSSTLKIEQKVTPTRLFRNDLRFIKRKVKEEGVRDTRFKTEAAAIRHYVHLGVIQEKRLETANNMNDRIIRSIQESVIIDSLKPLKKSIDDLIVVMENSDKRQTEYFLEQTRQGNDFSERLDLLAEIGKNQFDSLLKNLIVNQNVGRETVKNAVALRIVVYVALVGYKTGKLPKGIQPDWINLIGLIKHKIETGKAVEEVKALTSGNLETPLVQKIAEEVFAEIQQSERRT